MSRRRLAGLLRSPRDAWLVVRMAAWAVILPVLKFALPLPRLVRLLSNTAARPRDPARERRVSELASLLYRAHQRRFGDNCLERSLVTYRYLGRLGAEPSLTVAIGKEGGDVIGHVWVSVDGTPVQDAPDFLARYVPVITFDPRGNATKV